jgi:hypothetical protein
MSLKFHALILATSIAAVLAVGIASAAILTDGQEAAPKGDRLAMLAVAPTKYVTVETRHQGVSVLERVPLN